MTPPGPGLPGIHDWIGTRTAFEITRGPGGPLLALTVAIDTLPPPDAAAQYTALAGLFGETGQEDFTPSIVASCDTHAVLAPAPLTHDTYGFPLSERLAAFIDDARHWLAQGEDPGPPPSTTVYLPLSITAPESWTADLQQLDVRLTLAADAAVVDSQIPPGEDAAFASCLEEAFDNFDGQGTRIKAARRATSAGNELWLLRWGGTAGTRVTFRGEADPPVVLLIPPLSAAPITREVDGTAYTDVDLDSLASGFLAALDAMEPRTDAVAGVRRDLAAAIAATAVPAWRTPGDAFDANGAAAGIARMLEQDLTLATRAASIAQIGASVTSGIASGSQPEPEWRINGAVSGDAGHALSTGGVPLTAGGPTIEVMFVPAKAGALTSVSLTPAFSADRIEEPGAVPLRFPIPEVVSLGALTMPIPLRTPPPPVTARDAAASQDDDAGADGFEPRWRYAVTIDRPAAAQDIVAVVVTFDGAGTEPDGSRAAATPPAQAALFDAIVRFTNAYPSRASGAVERARAVVDAWRRWTPDAAQESAPIEEGPLAYAIGLDADGRALRVEAIGATAGREVWPGVEGYAFEPPEPGTRRARFVPVDAAPRGFLTLVFGSLDARQTRNARARFWIDRNREVAPAGRHLDPRFIRRGATSATDVAEPPTLRNRAPIQLPRASSLLASLQNLFAAVGAPAATEMAIAYSYSIGAGLKTRLPVLMVSREAAAAGGATAAEIGRALAAWKAQASPSGTDGALEFDIKVWADDDTQGRTIPLFWFTDVSLDVPDAPGWWDGGAGSGQPPAPRV